MTDKSIKHELVGTITSDKMNKTVVVTVERLEKHPVFQKYIRRRTKFKAHDEKNACRQGDKVLIRECRPLSKDKCWRVVNILERQE
ncbi:MAG: 30S ribosomal protein S17 [Desulfomonilia bacterium]|jgi:small subunit ribosomal protein S17|nr:30S ribosomal protein S17 [Deltaproteobacteria bacterium]MDX9762444.1 30S ribosomal protein S17 [Desulfomonilia bacterium]HPW69999.1 30S ribosomal protein S17 [Deltaproteobacteria bacterium]